MNGRSASRRLYRLLLRAWPREYRGRYGAEMEESFMALLRRDTRRHGLLGTVACWAGATWDALTHGWTARWAAHGHKSDSGRGDTMGALFMDLRFAVRALARRPVFTVTAVLTLALGIGANAAVFTVVNGFLFTPLPYDDPGELVTLRVANPELGWRRTDVNPADAWDWRARSRTLEDVAVFYGDGLNFTGGGEPELVDGVRTSPNLFGLLGRSPRSDGASATTSSAPTTGSPSSPTGSGSAASPGTRACWARS